MTDRLEVLLRLEASLPAEPLASLRQQDGARALALLARELSRPRDTEALREQILDKLLALFPGAIQAQVLVVEGLEPTEWRRLAKQRGEKSSSQTVFSEALAREVLEGRRAVLAEEPFDDIGGGEAAAPVAPPARRHIGAPLLAHDGTLLGGVLLMAEPLTGRFEEGDLSFLVTVSALIGATLSAALDRDAALVEQRAKLEQDMALRVHRSFLPQGVPLLPGYSFHQHCVSADRVGGDYFDFIPRPDGGIVMVVADVSGKGLPAALYMARLSAELRAQVAIEPSLAAVLARLNDTFRQLRKEVMYITCALAALQPDEHRLEIALAGHPPPILMRGGRVDPATGEDLGGGLPLGLFADGELLSPYTSTRIDLAPGDTVLLYSDGITEATNPQQEEYGTERLVETLMRAPGDLPAISRHLLHGLETFRAGRPADDDTTMVFLQRDR